MKQCFFESGYPVIESSLPIGKFAVRIAVAGAIAAALNAGGACESMPTGPVIPRGQEAPIEYVHEQPTQTGLPQNGGTLAL